MNFESIQERFSKTAERLGENPAIEVAGAQVMTYGELEKKSNRLANYLVRAGLPRGTLVALLAEDVPEIVAGILGILKAGGAFVPLDPNLPRGRIAAIVDEVAPRWFVAESRFLDRLAAPSTPAAAPPRLVLVDAPRELAVPAPFHLENFAAFSETEKRLVEPDPDDRCYVYFTSGSTGRPKGIVGRLKGIDHFVRWEIDTFGLGEGIRVSQLTTPSFDAFLRDVFVPLCAGGTVCVPESREAVLDDRRLRDWIDRSEVELLHCVPSLFRSILRAELSPERFPRLRYVFLAGEPLFPADVKRWVSVFGERVRLVNLYGSSETTMTKLYYLVEPADQDRSSIPIGKPMKGAAALVVDARDRPCAPGQPGEIIVRTPFATHGYYNQPALTDRVFTPNPFSDDPEDRVYRTGDMGRIMEDGNFEFLGRKDRQVKIRGVRIELAEVESCLRASGAADDVAVLAREDGEAGKSLCAYVVLSKGADLESLRGHVAGELPESMVPSFFVTLDALPRTPTGKVDPQALPAPAEELARNRSYQAPGTQVEELLAELWAQVLDLEQVGIHDNFFEWGGHSLLATQLLSRVRKVFGVDLPLRTLFEAPTVASLSPSLEEAMQSEASSYTPPPLEPAPRTGGLPLSFAQERLWFLDQLEPGSAFYNLPRALRLTGKLEVGVLGRALGEIVRRHESLRTTFHAAAGKPVQVIASAMVPSLPLVDLVRLGPERREAELRRQILAEVRRPFDLARGPVLRALLLRMGSEDHAIAVTMHHIASDGWSLDLFVREIASLYEALHRGAPPPLPELPVQYADFASWQRGWLRGEVLERKVSYWKEKLAGAPPVLELPTDRPRPAVQTYDGARRRIRLPDELSAALQELSRQHGVTLYMTLLAAFQSLLHRYTGQNEIIASSPIANRNRIEIENLIGFFANSLVLHSEFSADPSFEELLAKVRETTLEAYTHQDVPFEKLVQELQPQRDLALTPLFQVMFIFQEAMGKAFELPGLRWSLLETDTGKVKVDLTLALGESEGALSGALEYNRDLFDATTVERLARHLKNLLEDARTRPGGRVSQLRLLTAGERQQLSVEWTETRATASPTVSLCHLFERRVSLCGDTVALVHENRRLTYGELDRRADRLARYLEDRGVAPEVPVGLCMERSERMVVAILGILKAGGVYVPLDPAYPQKRLDAMLDDAGALLVLSSRTQPASLGGAGPRWIASESIETQLAMESPGSRERPVSRVTGAHLAYLIYTSGSTGRPKGVALEHRGAVALVEWALATFEPAELSGVLFSTSICFDLSIFELFAPLASGGTVVLVENALRLAGLDHADEVTLVNTVPSAMHELLRSAGVPPSVRTVNLAGEALERRLVEKIYEQTRVHRVWNLYGPSEETTYSTGAVIRRAGSGAPSIGRPIRGTEARVVRPFPEILPVGAAGELHLDGQGLARGYLGRPAQTARVFLPHPASDVAGRRLYRTGDLVRYRCDARLEFLGRIDHQVKIRGFRIELEEVEATLARHPGVREAVAVTWSDPSGDLRLVGHVVPLAGSALTVSELQAYAADFLPRYMVPEFFVFPEALPRLPNGKVHRRALPAPQLERSRLGVAYEMPRSAMERHVSAVWQQVLDLEKVGVNDNFFELGGHSLLMVQVRSRLEETLGRQVSLIDTFRHPTVGSLSRFLSQEQDQPTFEHSHDRASKKKAAIERRKRAARGRVATA